MNSLVLMVIAACPAVYLERRHSDGEGTESGTWLVTRPADPQTLFVLLVVVGELARVGVLDGLADAPGEMDARHNARRFPTRVTSPVVAHARVTEIRRPDAGCPLSSRPRGRPSAPGPFLGASA